MSQVTAMEQEGENGRWLLLQHLEQCINEHCWVRRLLVGGWFHVHETIDATGRDMLAYLAIDCANDEQCTKTIIAFVLQVFDPATACYNVLKLNSLELFKEYLSSAGLGETATLENVGSAIIHLSASNITLSEELDLYVKWKLAEYGHGNLTGDLPYSEASDSCKSHLGILCECWDDIVKHKYNVNDDVDDRFLHRVYTIHNQLYFLRLKTYLKHLPVLEVLFCMAIFVKIHKDPENYRPYRMMICKRFVIECLEAIVMQLKFVLEQLEQIESLLREIVPHVLTVDAQLTRQIVEKLETSTIRNKNHYLERYHSAQGSKDELVKDMVKLFKKVDRTFYETMTKEMNTSDRRGGLIGKLKRILPCVIHPENACNQIMADVKKKKPIETIVFNIMEKETIHFDDATSLQPATLEAIRRCYNEMKQVYLLTTIQKHYSLFEDADQLDEDHAAACSHRCMMMIGEAYSEFIKLDTIISHKSEGVHAIAEVHFKDVVFQHRNIYTHILSWYRLKHCDEQFERHLLELVKQNMKSAVKLLYFILLFIAAAIRHSFYRKLQQCDTLDSLRTLLMYTGENDCLQEVEEQCMEYLKKHEEIGAIGNTGELDHLMKDMKKVLAQLGALERRCDYASVWKTCFASSDLVTIKKLLSWKLAIYDPSFALESMNKWFDVISSRKKSIKLTVPPILELLNIRQKEKVDWPIEAEYSTESVKECMKKLKIDVESIDYEGFETLNENLIPYYENIFRVEKKWSVLKDFCMARNIWNSETDAQANELKKADLNELQALFNERHEQLQTVFVRLGIRTADDLVHKMHEISSNDKAEMEFIQCEMCKMMLTVNYFGDNFPALKHSLPAIQGKSYRNYLAHDRLSYDVVTNSGDEKCVINAFVIAKASIELFGKRRQMSSLKLPSFKDWQLWIDQQQDLRSAFASGDVSEIHAKLKAGAEIKGQYNCSPDARYQPTKLRTLADLFEWSNQANPSVVALLCQYFPTFRADYGSEERQISNALARRDFETAYSKISKKHEFRKELLAWPNLRTLEYVDETSVLEKYGFETVLKMLFDYGNSLVALELIRSHEQLLTAQTDPTVELMNQLLAHAMLRDNMADCCNVLLSKLNCRLLPTTLELAIVVNWKELIHHNAAKPVFDDVENCDNLLVVAVTMFNKEVVEKFIGLGQHKNCYKIAASLDIPAVLNFLIENHPIEDERFMSGLLLQAAGNRRWECVRLLLQMNAGTVDVYKTEDGKEHTVLNLLVQWGKADLILCIKRLNHKEFYGSILKHPILVAFQYKTFSDEMFQAIRALRLSCFQTHSVLHRMAMEGKMHIAFAENREREIIRPHSNFSSHPSAHSVLVYSVLSNWKRIAILEKPSNGETTLSCAAKAEHQFEEMGKVLNLARELRKLEVDGSVLGDLAIGKGRKIVQFSREDNSKKILKRCDKFRKRLSKFLKTPSEWYWEDRTLTFGTSVVTFTVLGVIDINRESLLTEVQLSDTNLTANLQSLRTITGELFGDHSTTVYATLSNGSCILHFFRIDDWCCAFELHPPNSTIDLSSMVNSRLTLGETCLYEVIKSKCNLDTVKLLIENGANPLLTDNFNKSALYKALFGYSTPAIVGYLVQMCKEKNLRNEKGRLLEEITVGRGNHRLLALADEYTVNPEKVAFLLISSGLLY